MKIIDTRKPEPWRYGELERGTAFYFATQSGNDLCLATNNGYVALHTGVYFPNTSQPDDIDTYRVIPVEVTICIEGKVY